MQIASITAGRRFIITIESACVHSPCKTIIAYMENFYNWNFGAEMLYWRQIKEDRLCGFYSE